MLLDAQSELNLKNKSYIRALESFVWGNYELDLPKTDITTELFDNESKKNVFAMVIAKQKGVLAGIQEASWFLNKLKIKILAKKKDGDLLKKGDVILKLQGKASAILAAERTLLNMLQRMSGIATKTKQLSQKIPKNIKLLATRKTLWGALDKRAVSIGGGGTHRLNLSDAILVKENHLILSSNFDKSLKNIFKTTKSTRFLEIELENQAQVKKFISFYEAINLKKLEKKVVVMLDNFKPNQVKEVIKPLKKLGLIVEVSGGINENTISRYTIKGVDAISSGAITMAAPHLDLSLDINPPL